MYFLPPLLTRTSVSILRRLQQAELCIRPRVSSVVLIVTQRKKREKKKK